jgi:hypothetical protein
MRFIVKVPGLGLVTAGVYALAGNTEHAKQAFPNNTNALITTVRSFDGFIIGRPVGAIAGGTLTSRVGIGAECAISTPIDDNQVKGNIGDTSLGRRSVDTVLFSVGGLVGEVVVPLLSKLQICAEEFSPRFEDQLSSL